MTEIRPGLMRIGRSERDERLLLSPQEEDIALKLAQDAFELHPSNSRLMTRTELWGIIREALKQQHCAGVRAPAKPEERRFKDYDRARNASTSTLTPAAAATTPGDASTFSTSTLTPRQEGVNEGIVDLLGKIKKDLTPDFDASTLAPDGTWEGKQLDGTPASTLTPAELGCDHRLRMTGASQCPDCGETR